MQHYFRATVIAVAITGGALLATTGAANAATPGELNLNLETSCSDMSINPGQTQMDECVQLLQEDLNAMGASIATDGYFGPETQGAVARFQSHFSVNDRQAGVADQPTRHALQEDVTAKQKTDGHDPNAGPNGACDDYAGPLSGPCKILFGTGTAN